MDTETLYSVDNLAPLGEFGVIATQQEFASLRERLVARQNEIDPSERGVVASYLRSGAIVLALMEHTFDVIGAAFGVPGGSAVLTDGEYYWRCDAAEYVERYGIGLPSEFLSSRRTREWKPVKLAPEDVLRADRFLTTHGRKLRSH